MRRAATLGAAALACVGLGLFVLGDWSVWARLLGIQATMMGLYTIALASEDTDALRLALRGRLVLVAAELLWWLLTPSCTWWLLVFGLECAWLVLTPGVLRGATPAVFKRDKTAFPSHLHNLVLGSIPLGEGVGALIFGAVYGPLALGVVTPAEVLPDAALFGLHTLYLAFFWAVVVRARARRAMAATAAGRVGVAAAFVGFHAAGIVGDDARFWILAPLLVLSACWTALELRWPLDRTKHSPTTTPPNLKK